MNSIFYRRNLPHFQVDYSYYFVTFRLFNSLQKEVTEKLKKEYYESKKIILKLKDEIIRSAELYKLQKRYFGIFDNHLDANRECINYLSDLRIAGIVNDAIKFRDGKEYNLNCFCIMPNHVHLMFFVQRFGKPLYRIMQSLKRYTASESNKILNRTGQFWHEESYDHIVRNENEYYNIINYIINNPVKAGLVENAFTWKWSYYNFSQYHGLPIRGTLL